MKFDNIIGNPPYNNDMYIDFMYNLNSLSNSDMLMIVPAKLFFNKELIQDKFNKINRYIKKCIFYQCEGEVFKINMASGIAIFIIGKESRDTTHIKNISNVFESFNTDEFIEVNKDIKTFNINAMSIINKVLSQSEWYKISENDLSGRYKCTARKQAYVLGGSANANRSIFYYDDRFDKGWVTNSFSIEEETKLGVGRIILFSSNNTEECKSFISYINTRLVRYLIAVGASGYSNILNDTTFRFVPKQSKFDHIFTDAELYEKYKLSEDEINIIESVIKERDICI